MILESMPVGPLQCNCVILADSETHDGVVIDPGDDAEAIEEILDQHGIRLRYILHTHAHIDHILAADRLRKDRGGVICLHPADRFLWDQVAMQGQFLGMRVAPLGAIDHDLRSGESIPFGKHHLEVIETPGHTPGSVCLLLRDGQAGTPSGASILFSGDTLFARGIGRTDLWGGSYRGILTSIRDRIFTLDEETLVHPGHGEMTSVRDEKRKNPFLSDIRSIPEEN